jgi:parvulin-like peptidyl-prolyl cis-trans isomerase-like protein
MLRVFVIAMLTCASATAQTAPVTPPPSARNTPAGVQQPTFHPERVKADTVVLEIQGVCSGMGDGFTMPAPCVTKITRDQFLSMVTAVGVNSPNAPSAAHRSFAESYVQLLALADAAEKAGIDKDSQFEELMKIVRVRTLGEAYRRYLEAKFGNPSQEDVEAYYKQNTTKFETIKVERVIVPVAARKITGSPAEVAKKTRELAAQIRERAVNGEDMTLLQTDAYKTLGLPAPPNTDMGSRRRGSFQPSIEAELFALKAGEVTKIESEPAGLTVYRLRSRGVPPLEQLRGEILKEMHEKNVENTIKAVMDNVHTNLNLDYFTPAPVTRIPNTHLMTSHPLELHPKPATPATTPADGNPPKP